MHNAFDEPGSRKIHARSVPRLGGVAIFIAVSLGMALAGLGVILGWLTIDDKQIRLLPAVYIGLCGFFAIGFVDDLRSLPALPRLAGQLAVALAVVLVSGGAISVGSLFGHLVLPGWLATIITVAWIVGVVNTFNWIDGLDGLAAGLGGISALAFLALVVLKPGQPNAMLTAMLCVLLLGATIGFLFYNFHPAKIFIGDGGAFSLGYLLAVISILSLFKQAAIIAFILPILILALPISDTAFAILRRLIRGQPITKPDDKHIHHRTLALMSRSYRAGLPDEKRAQLQEQLAVNPAHRNAVLALYIFAAVFAGAAVVVGASL
jgi:UDP-GlcNAc:undecaprenyl-phosphate GlcNAc-1-phosphate transferase